LLIGFLRDIVEVLIYILLPATEFRCVPARMLLRVCVFNCFSHINHVFIFKEVAVNLGLVPFIDMYTDPDAINQIIIKMVTRRRVFIKLKFYF
jgi:hypothetical protein